MPITSQGTLSNGTSKAQNTNFFATSITPKSGGGSDPTKIRITLWVSTANAVLQFTRDGTNFASLNAGAALNAGQWYLFDTMVRPGDALNLQFSNAAGGTLGAFAIDEIDNES